MTRGSTRPRRIAFFGSSSIYGTGDHELGGFVNRFRLWLEAIDPRHRVYNLGVWGEETDQLVERITAEATARRVHLILIYPGFNDCRRDGSIDAPNARSIGEYRSVMSEVIATSQAICETVVMTGFPFDASRTTPLRNTQSYFTAADAEAYTRELVDTSRERNARVIDFFGELCTEDKRDLLSDDGLHGNPACHQLLFEITKEFFRSTYGIGGT